MTDDPVPQPQPRPDAGRLAAGATIILLGVLLLLDRAGVMDWANRAGWWAIAAIAFGVLRMTTGGGLRAGAFFILAGVWGLLNEFGVLSYDKSWPLLLVIVGGSMVIGSLTEPSRPVGAPMEGGPADAWRLRRHRGRSGPLTLLWVMIFIGVVTSFQGGRRSRDMRNDSDDVIQRSAVLGESRTVSYASQLRRGRLAAVMGTCDVDLTHAAVAPGEEAILELAAIMGQVRLRVPDDWVVDIQTVPALGSVRDLRSRPVTTLTAGASSGAPGQTTHLVLRGFVMMGDVIVRN